MVDKPYPVTKSDDEWKSDLTQEEFNITRKKGTERAFTGAYWKTKEPGMYHCTCCGAQLFDSKTKFDSGTGWPSFYDAIPGSIELREDRGHGMVRTETACSRCGAHLGHLFDDGPEPTGQRYCINSASLKLKKENEENA